MESATWCRMSAAASAARRLRPEVSKNSSTALSSNEGELARSITTCVPAMASLRPSPVMVLTPLLGEAATPWWPRWGRMGAVFEPMRPVPPMMTIFIARLLVRSPRAGAWDGRAASCLPEDTRHLCSFAALQQTDERVRRRRRDLPQGVGVTVVERRRAARGCQIGACHVRPAAVTVEGVVDAIVMGAERRFEEGGRATPEACTAAARPHRNALVVRLRRPARQHHLPA